MLVPGTHCPIRTTPIVIQLCLRSPIGLWGKYYCALFDIMLHFSSDVGLQTLLFSLQDRGVEVTWLIWV